MPNNPTRKALRVFDGAIAKKRIGQPFMVAYCFSDGAMVQVLTPISITGKLS
jgi:hypothetical protein